MFVTWPSMPSTQFIALSLACLLSSVACGQGTPSMRATDDAPASVRLVEFYNAAQDHYFVTAAPNEIADLDAGVHPGWERTGLSFNVNASDVDGANPVCRFYIPPALGDSHFYSASADECLRTRQRFPGFVLESAAAFRIGLPDTSVGACPARTIPVYRLWDGRVDSNHRYTTDAQTRQHMRSVGWIAEGYGDDQVIMCAPSAANVDVALSGRAITKARAGGDTIAALEERPTSIFEQGPDRVVALLHADGSRGTDYVAPAGWTLADIAVHPSGDVSVVLTTPTSVRLVRLHDDVVGDDDVLVDPAGATDPFFDYDGTPKNDEALQPFLMHDAARLAPLGESLALVIRTGRNAVVAYRFDVDASGRYQRTWRTLVEPGSSIDGVFLSSGSFDTFAQFQNHVAVHADAGDDGTIVVGLVELPFRNYLFRAHAAFFGEPVAAQADLLVTRIAADGHRLGSTVIDTTQQAELHGVRATAQGIVLTGRVLTEVRADGGGWDAFIARVASDGTSSAYRVVDVDRGDVLFDAAPLPNGRYLALGTTGYVQNPSGASVSEDTRPLLALLDANGSVLHRFSVWDGPRQDQLRSILRVDDRWIVGGMRNGPGTHSGDGRPDLITADGFLLEMNGLSTP
jgi:hypothetical protein